MWRNGSQGCSHSGLELVRQQVTTEEQKMQGWEALGQSVETPAAPIPLPNGPINTTELQAVRDWYRQGLPPQRSLASTLSPTSKC